MFEGFGFGKPTGGKDRVRLFIPDRDGQKHGVSEFGGRWHPLRLRCVTPVTPGPSVARV
jgi:hypothetical protein